MKELKKLNTTLLLIIKDNKILLAKKKRGFAAGVLIGIGGKQDKGETIREALVRECQEEINATPINFKQVGLIDFDTYYKGEHCELKLNIFTCSDYVGEIQETEEMEPYWFDINNIPYDKMLEDDKLWMTKVLSGETVKGKVVFNEKLQLQHSDIYKVSKNYFENEMVK